MQNSPFLHLLKYWMLGGVFFFLPSFTLAQIVTSIKGELVTARQVTIDGERPISGLTLWNEHTIKTSTRGVAIISLGRNGRIELGPETDYTLLLAAPLVGGELRAGRIILTIPTNISIAIKGAGCLIETGGESSTLSVEIRKERLAVALYQGAAKINYTGKTEFIASGQEVWSSLLAWNWQHRELSNQNINKMSAQIPSLSSAIFFNFINASIIESFQHLITSFSLPPSYYDSTLTCRNHNNLRCYSNGGMKP